MNKYILSIDQGTTSSRAIIFDDKLNIIAIAQQEVANLFPNPGWVQIDANEIWLSVKNVCNEALQKANLKANEIAAIGITNQRETTIVWDKDTAEPVYDGLVWQSRQSSYLCEQLVEAGYSKLIKEKTGLTIDSYFSASKIRWILDHIEDGQKRAESNQLLAGTVDSWLLYKLTSGEVHATDVTNASRTMLMNLDTLQWDDELLDIWNIPMCMLPEIKSSSEIYGSTDIFGDDIKIAGMGGDQQCALFGQMCFSAGMAKNTYGTGCFLLFNTGEKKIESSSGLLTTVGYKISDKVTYALEGSVFVAGAAIQWLRDGLKIINNAADSQHIAESLSDSNGVYVVPAFTGLGAPYWDSDARGAMFGLTRGTSTDHIVRATLESLAYQSYDVIEAMEKDTGCKLSSLLVDGGACRNDYLMQFQADILQSDIIRPVNFETTATGAAMFAGLAVGIFKNIDELKKKHVIDKTFKPIIKKDEAKIKIQGWKKAVKATMEY